MKDQNTGTTETPIRSQQDYLIRRITIQKALANYYYFRSKSLPYTDDESIIETMMDNVLKALDKTYDDLTIQDLTDHYESEMRKLRKHIELFFKGLHIDPNLFKKKRRYQVTSELGNFFEYILDHDEDITSHIIGKKYRNVSNRAYHRIYNFLLDALSTAPCSEEKKEQAKKKFLVLMEQNGIDLSFQMNNDMLDAILGFTRSRIIEEGWKPNPDKYPHVFFDSEWAVVCEGVYKDLYESGYLISKPDEHLGEVLRLVSDGDIPPELLYPFVPIPLPQEQEQAEKGRASFDCDERDNG